MNKIIERIYKDRDLTLDELKAVFAFSEEEREKLFAKARQVGTENFGKNIYLRGLIEISSFCKNDCFYCGIRKSNSKAERYRLEEDVILECCKTGRKLGFMTFVLQGGEDEYYTDDVIERIIMNIKKECPDCAVTLSLGERSKESYQRLFEAGADRYLLRHETADNNHYRRLHPPFMSLENRKQCLYNLKEIGYQTGCGIMVGSPFQTVECIYEDIKFMKNLQPHMIGIGPFITHKDTPFKDFKSGSVDDTLVLLSVLRLIFPKVLLPATTALGTMDPMGREKGILAGANVLMPNLSPVRVRKKYSLYDNKICMGEEAAECSACLRGRIERIGYKVTDCRGDYGVVYE
ncbi:MAG: [FeFe] hydrogenase H-cluster radical SAM maturase HydE [Clostridiales bacterium]|nr:[FeFe] hydrogenase H-cluster radical SAM maturase HydE [Clostridiales bacterium]